MAYFYLVLLYIMFVFPEDATEREKKTKTLRRVQTSEIFLAAKTRVGSAWNCELATYIPPQYH